MGKNVFGEMCAITGAPAKYRDPVSGLPYADLAAFKVIKERYHTAKPEAVEVSSGAPTCSLSSQCPRLRHDSDVSSGAPIRRSQPRLIKREEMRPRDQHSPSPSQRHALL